MDGGHSVVFEVSVKCEDDPYLCILEKWEKEHFPQGTRIRERRITSLIDLHLDEIPSSFFYLNFPINFCSYQKIFGISLIGDKAAW